MKRQRWIGAIVGACIAIGIGGLGVVSLDSILDWRGLATGFAMVPQITLLSTPLVAWLGWRLAPGAVGGSRAHALMTGIKMAVLTVGGGAFWVVGLGLVASMPDAVANGSVELRSIPFLVALPVIGILVVGPFALTLTIPAGLLWAAIVRVVGRPAAEEATT